MFQMRYSGDVQISINDFVAIGWHCQCSRRQDANAKGVVNALNATKHLGLGVAGVDLIRSKKGPLLIEVNASPGLRGIESATGVNVAKEIIQFVERNGRRRRK